MDDLDLYAEEPTRQRREDPEPPGEGEPLDLYDGVAAPDGAAVAGRARVAGALPEWMRSVWQTFPRDIRDRYEPRCVLGRGGMGIVLEALDRQMQRTVAIKGLREPATAPLSLRVRQAEEARIAASLTHPNILPVFDLWQDAQGNPWCSMLRVPGAAPTLGHRLNQLAAHKAIENRPLAELLDIFLQICRAVAYAHGQGVLHRDLKPDNIFLGPSGEALVADWGMALRLDAPVGPAERFVGTPGYAPPEQSGHPDAEPPSPASDIFSLGVVLFELVVGRHHLDLPTGMHVSSPRSPEPMRELEVPARTPKELAAIISRATAWRPGERYGSVREMIRALDVYLSGGVLEGIRYSTRERLLRWVRGHPAVTATAISSVFFVALLAQRTAKEARTQARLLNEATANLAQAFAEKATTELQNGGLDRSLAYAALAVETCAKVAQPPPVAACRVLAESGRVGWCVARRRLPSPAGALAFRADGRLLLIGDDLGGLDLVDPAGESPAAGRQRHPAGIVSVCLAQKPAPLITLDRAGATHFWRWPDWSTPATHPASMPPLESIALLSDGSRLAGIDTAGRVRVWSTDASKPSTTLALGDFRARSLAFAPGGSGMEGSPRLAAGGDDATLRVLDAESGMELAAVRGFSGPVNLVAFSPDAQLLAACGGDQRIVLWNLAAWKPAGTLSVRGYPATALAIAPAGTLLAWGASDGTIVLADWRTAQILGRLEGHGGAIRSLAWTGDGRTLGSVSADGFLCVWDTWRSGGGDRLEQPPDFTPPARLAFSAGGESIAGAATEPTGPVQVWELATRRMARPRSASGGGAASYAFAPLTTGPVVVTSPDGEWRVAGEADGSLLLSAPSRPGGPSQALRAHRSPITAIAFAGKRGLFASAAEGGAIFLWEAPTAACLDLLASLELKVLALAFSPDGRTLAASVEHGPVRLWDVSVYLRPRALAAWIPGASLFAGRGLDLELRRDATFTKFPGHHPLGVGGSPPSGD